ncbi:MAG: hypothetical protein FJ284_06680 [Planctomycetes bacterium]|nr:hypothetical protein [Planctomycetota bacterium]
MDCLRPHLVMGLVVAVAAVSAAAQIPSDAGQVWKTYDLGPFVTAAGPGSERHVVDWILQDTGYPAWHGQTAASLSGGDGRLACFHTPDMQAKVAEIVARFTDHADRPHRFSVRVFGFDGPRWRADARPALQPMPTAGVQAWILPRESATAVLARLRSRGDVLELPTGPVLAANGLPANLTGGRRQPYVQDYLPTPAVAPGWQPHQATCDEGLAIDLQPLVSADASAVEAAFRCRIDQIERLAALALPAPGGGATVLVQVPQLAAVRIGERFRWPTTHTLVIGLGLVPWPVPAQNGALSALIPEVERRDIAVVVEPRPAGDR